MPETPEPQPAQPPVDDTAADTGSLIDLGIIPEEPIPSTGTPTPAATQPDPIPAE
ncbi:hypothetical protein ACFXCZ_27030 [Streptomyces sp. NPDC059396]|uniref:hypothetical protein n=1 Tax=Streptomyces sp. NPDC059396 TaxID=3346819 RepID=UPI0036AC5800